MRVFWQWILTAVLALVLSDNILWLLNFPLANYSANIDPLCLWTLTPGEQKSLEDPQITEHINSDGLRRAYPDSTPKRPYRVLCMGCSFTYGVGVRDEDTYVWRLNELCPQILFDNGGVGGYGSYRAYIRLQRLLCRHQYDLVIYAMIDDHFRRCSIPLTRFDISEDKRFMNNDKRKLSNLYAMPCTDLEPDFRFADYPLRRFQFPGDGISPLSNFLNQLYTTHTVRSQHVPSESDQTIIFANHMERMAQLAAAFGSKFLLISLDGHRINEKLYPSWITVYNNRFYRDMSVADLVGHQPQNHPNAAVHKYWAEKLASYLQQEQVFRKLVEYRKVGDYPKHRMLYDLLPAEGS
ncbi:SGNH/GDSL hydrolase family protein [bacterium]|nr:SGNH/GDSL hydrolase family protein [bacterium]